MTKLASHRRWLPVAECLVLVAVALVTACLYPLPHAARMTAALAVAYAVPRSLYCRTTDASTTGRAVLLLSAMWLAVIAIAFVHRATMAAGASFTLPWLYNDAADYYDWALAHYDGSAVQPKVTFWGYPALILGLWRVLGVNIIWPVAANVMATLTTLVLAGQLARRIDTTHRPQVGVAAMAMVAVMGFLASQGSQMLKESWAYLAITLIAYGLAPSSNGYGSGKHDALVRCAWYAAGCFLLAAVRAKYVNFMFIGIAMMALAGRLRQWRYYGSLLGVTLLCWMLGMAMTDHYTVVQQVNNVTGQGGMADLFQAEGAYQHILGDYYHYPIWKRLLYLPVTCSVQWLIPFPWLPAGESVSLLNIAPRLRMGWYVLSGVVLYFYLFRSCRRDAVWAAWAWIPVMCYVGIAFMTAGTVSRYILAFQPWWMSLAAITLFTCRRQPSFRWFMLAYLSLMAIALTACFLMS